MTICDFWGSCCNINLKSFHPVHQCTAVSLVICNTVSGHLVQVSSLMVLATSQRCSWLLEIVRASMELLLKLSVFYISLCVQIKQPSQGFFFPAGTATVSRKWQLQFPRLFKALVWRLHVYLSLASWEALVSEPWRLASPVLSAEAPSPAFLWHTLCSLGVMAQR